MGQDGLRVVGVDRDDGGALTVTVKFAPSVKGHRTCGLVARAHGRLEVHLVEAPAMGRAVRYFGHDTLGFAAAAGDVAAYAVTELLDAHHVTDAPAVSN